MTGLLPEYRDPFNKLFERQILAASCFREADRYSAPCEGKLRSLDITENSLQKIDEVVSEFLEAFEAAAAELEKQGHLE